MTPFRWKNCYADVLTSKHDLTIESYFNDVIVPALDTLNEKIEVLGKSDWPGAVFAQADMTDMLRESRLAFGLAIQSIWERSEEHTSELQSLMRISYAVFCLKK